MCSCSPFRCPCVAAEVADVGNKPSRQLYHNASFQLACLCFGLPLDQTSERVNWRIAVRCFAGSVF
jgi:hypothetical protein